MKTDKMKINGYYNDLLVGEQVSKGLHRELVGGLWDELRALQIHFLVNRGLKPEMRFLDVGCGCLRAGCSLVDYLSPGNYYGLDISRELIDAGYEIEMVSQGIQHKLPRSNLIVDEYFSFHKFNQQFDMSIAQSLFTHLPLNHIRLCLMNLVAVMNPGTFFFATFFECSTEQDVRIPVVHIPGDVTTYMTKDPYHYRFSDMVFCTQDLPWRIRYIGDWGHPRSQKMIEFKRI